MMLQLSRCQVVRANPVNKSLESWSRRTNNFDDEVMMDLMRFGQPCAKFISWLIKLWKARCKTDVVFAILILQHWFCNCQVVSLDIPIDLHQKSKIKCEFKTIMNLSLLQLKRVRKVLGSYHPIMEWIKLWKCTMQNRLCFATLILQLSRLPGWTCQSNEQMSWDLILQKRAFRWWSHDGLDERFGQPCAKSFLDGRHDANRRCFCNTDFATVKSSAWTYESNEHILNLWSRRNELSMMKPWWAWWYVRTAVCHVIVHGSSYGNARCKTDAVLQLWCCNCHVVRLYVPIQWTNTLRVWKYNMQNHTCFCNSDFATVKSSAYVNA